MRRLHLNDYDRTSVVMTSTTAVSDLIKSYNELLDEVLDLRQKLEFTIKEIHSLKSEQDGISRRNFNLK
jgi:regulator of replication initiation timing